LPNGSIGSNRIFWPISPTKSEMTLCSAFLDLAKLEKGQAAYLRESVNLWHLLGNVIAELENHWRKKELKLVLEPPTLSSKVVVDTHKIEQVCRQLIGNAIRYSPPQTEVTIGFAPGLLEFENGPVPALLTEIRDQGPGIPEDELQLIFEPFVQSSRTKNGAGGTGLGLAIVRDLIEGHRGRVWAENHPQGGAIFRFLLPRR